MNKIEKKTTIYTLLSIFSFFTLALLSSTVTMWVFIWPDFLNVITNGYIWTNASMTLRNSTFIITFLFLLFSIFLITILIYIRNRKNKLNEEKDMYEYFEKIAFQNKKAKINNSYGINLNSDLVKSAIEKDEAGLQTLFPQLHNATTINANFDNKSFSELERDNAFPILMPNNTPLQKTFDIENDKFENEINDSPFFPNNDIDNNSFIDYQYQSSQLFGTNNAMPPFSSTNNRMTFEPSPQQTYKMSNFPNRSYTTTMDQNQMNTSLPMMPTYFANTKLNNSFGNSTHHTIHPQSHTSNVNIPNFNSVPNNQPYSTNTNEFINFDNITPQQNYASSSISNHANRNQFLGQYMPRPIYANTLINNRQQTIGLNNLNNKFSSNNPLPSFDIKNKQQSYEQTKNSESQLDSSKLNSNWVSSSIYQK